MKSLLLTLFFFSSALSAEQKQTIAPGPSKNEIKRQRMQNASTKSRVWSLELATLRFVQNVNPGHSLNGVGGRVSIGYGLIGEHNLFLGDANLYFGPFGENYRTVSYDYMGTGATLTVGHGFTPLRGDNMGIGILGGASYQEFTGRFYGRNDSDKPVPATSNGIVTTYGNTISSADLNVGLFVSFMKPERPDTNDVESLITRNEGVILSLQGSLPVWSRFRARYSQLDASGASKDKTDKGVLEGFKIILSLRGFLGT